MHPKFCTNPVLKSTKSYIPTNLSTFLKLCLSYSHMAKNYLPLMQQIADLLAKIGIVRTLMPNLI